MAIKRIHNSPLVIQQKPYRHCNCLCEMIKKLAYAVFIILTLPISGSCSIYRNCYVERNTTIPKAQMTSVSKLIKSKRRPKTFKKFIHNPKINANQKIFNDTLKYIKSHDMSRIQIISYKGIKEGPSRRTIPRISVAPMTTLKMAQQLIQKGCKPLILDMANKSSPGGSVHEGSNAQEETLCRQSNLFSGLTKAQQQGYYPLPEEGGILLTNVTFFRDDDYCFLETPFQADVFASAAFDCNKNHRQDSSHFLAGYDRPEDGSVYREKTKMKMRAMFKAAQNNGNDALVLGAFGCGAFKNDPHTILKWYKEVLSEAEFQNIFHFIVFAIMDSQSKNFKTFSYSNPH